MTVWGMRSGYRNPYTKGDNVSKGGELITHLSSALVERGVPRMSKIVLRPDSVALAVLLSLGVSGGMPRGVPDLLRGIGKDREENR